MCICVCHMVRSGAVSRIKVACEQRPAGNKAVWEKNIKTQGAANTKAPRQRCARLV